MAGLLGSSPPSVQELQPLPGGGVGGPVVASNNPESVTGEGVLYNTAGAVASRGGTAYPLSGGFGIYFHHLNNSGGSLTYAVVLSNPGDADVQVSATGTATTGSETGGWTLGRTPPFVNSENWIAQRPNVSLPTTTIAPRRAIIVAQKSLGTGVLAEGRLGVTTSGPVYVYVVATRGADSGSIINMATSIRRAAAGQYLTSGEPAPPPIGREAGVYEFDTWKATIRSVVPPAGRHLCFVMNNCRGCFGNTQPVQAFRALTRSPGSAAEAAGMYGNVYDVTFELSHDGSDTRARAARLFLTSMPPDGSLTRFWDGKGMVNGQLLTIQSLPGRRNVDLATNVSVAPGATTPTKIQLRAMVPGLASTPQALCLEST
jgi:hypothetical protein